MIKIIDGSYVNPVHVIRYFVDEDVTREKPFAIKISVNGPQMPFTVSTHPTSEAAHSALDELIYARV